MKPYRTTVTIADRSTWYRRATPFALCAVMVAASCADSDDETHDHEESHPCDQPYAPDPRDATMSSDFIRLVTSQGDPSDPSDDQYDLTLPQEMVDWLFEQNWVQAHGDWHNVRRIAQACGQNTALESCPSAKALAERGLQPAAIQQDKPGDGYAFLVAHRHMIRGFKQAFPKHAELLRGFEHVPLTQEDPENPLPWVKIQWTDDQLASIKLLQDIENNLELFESEDDLGQWIQDGTLGAGGGGPPPGGFDGGIPDGGFPFPLPLPGPGDGGVSDGGRPAGGIHNGLHGQWSVPGSQYLLANNNANLPVVAFWRLHTWIDDMWERYRVAKGIGEEDEAYKAEMQAQCEEMHMLEKAPKPNDGTAAVETGVFAEKIAPIFKSYCSGCHDIVSPSKGVVLAGTAASTIRVGLVGVKASEVDMNLIDPGSPATSWLYRKITGDMNGIQCSGCTSPMPPAGAGPKAEEIETLRAWIAAGAAAD
ncbi:hypothetical protein [Hyalangium versicolor]|uniref:hypothetical protein n=1 Tax=Hyalangium versicolor TaxID=2861190 RepID=UPI001CCE919A|nr:hypothetical protein [Hyalangium versicolor]